MSFNSLMSEVPWLREIPNIRNILKYIPLSSTEKASQIYGRSSGEISVREWSKLPFQTKKQYLIVRKDKRMFLDISNDEFVSKYLPEYPQLATFIAVTPNVLNPMLLLKHLDKFSNQDRKSITANLRDNIDTDELSSDSLPFVVKKLLVALNKWDLKPNERIYITKDGNSIIKLSFGDKVKVGVYTAEDDYPDIKLNARTSKYLLDYPDINKIPFNNLLKLASNGVVDKDFINKILTQAQEDPNSAIVVKDTDTGKIILDSNSFTSYKLEDGKISPIPFDSEEVQSALSDETENTGFQNNAVNIVFSDEDEIPAQIDKDAFYRILNSTPYTNRTRGTEVALVDPEDNKILIMSSNIITDSQGIGKTYGVENDWRREANRWNKNLAVSSWRAYFDYLRSLNRSYTSGQLNGIIANLSPLNKKNFIEANPPMADDSRIRPAMINGRHILINTEDPRNSQAIGRSGRLIRASVPPNEVARILGGQAAAATPAAGRRGRPAGIPAAVGAGERVPLAAAPAAAAGGEANANTIASIEEAGLRAGFTTLPPNIRTRITAGTPVPYTRRNASLDAIGRVTGVINAGQSRFYIIRMPSGRVIGFATMQPDARHYIVTSSASYRVPRVSQLAASLQANNINESLKTLIRFHSVANPEEAKQIKEILLNLKK
jgi:hypothetical protein